MTLARRQRLERSQPLVVIHRQHGIVPGISSRSEKADEQAMRNAIYMAIDVLRSRKVYEEISADPLQKFKREGGADVSVADLPQTEATD